MHLHPRRVAQLLCERPGEARAIGVEAFAPAFAEDHRVDGADGACLFGEPGQQGQRSLLARMRDVETVEARRFGRVDQPRQIGNAAPVPGEIDQLIVQSESLAPGFLLVQRGREGFLNPLADQADQEFALIHLSPGNP